MQRQGDRALALAPGTGPVLVRNLTASARVREPIVITRCADRFSVEVLQNANASDPTRDIHYKLPEILSDLSIYCASSLSLALQARSDRRCWSSFATPPGTYDGARLRSQHLKPWCSAGRQDRGSGVPRRQKSSKNHKSDDSKIIKIPDRLSFQKGTRGT